jgi:hypothetical protein
MFCERCTNRQPISLGAAILSHHVDEFSLVAAFFLFAIGCLNMLAGLIFRQSAKSKRSITSWREHGKNSLPTHVVGVDIRPVAAAAPSLTPSVFKSEETNTGYGFGRHGERTAGLKGASHLTLTLSHLNVHRLLDLQAGRIAPSLCIQPFPECGLRELCSLPSIVLQSSTRKYISCAFFFGRRPSLDANSVSNLRV